MASSHGRDPTKSHSKGPFSSQYLVFNNFFNITNGTDLGASCHCCSFAFLDLAALPLLRLNTQAAEEKHIFGMLSAAFCWIKDTGLLLHFQHCTHSPGAAPGSVRHPKLEAQ